MPRVKKEILPPEHAATIKEYEKSNWWVKKSKALLDDRSCVCSVCGRPRWVWQKNKKVWHRERTFSAHHRTYENLPHEKYGDVLTVCGCCHKFCHDALRYQNISPMYAEVAEVVKRYFAYDGPKTFHPW